MFRWKSGRSTVSELDICGRETCIFFIGHCVIIRSVQSCEDSPFSVKFAEAAGHRNHHCLVSTGQVGDEVTFQTGVFSLVMNISSVLLQMDRDVHVINNTLLESAARCVKIIATVKKTKWAAFFVPSVLLWEYFRENVIIRGCVSKDVEALCGSFTYMRDKMKGCLLTCDEDFCNGQEKSTPKHLLIAFLSIGYCISFLCYSLFIF